MPGIDPHTSHYQDPAFRADDDMAVAVKKFIQGLVGGSLVVTPAGNFTIPAYDTVEFTYVGAGSADDDKIETQVFKRGGQIVSTLTYAYVGSTNNIASITQT